MENIDERIQFQQRRVQGLRNQVHSQYQLSRGIQKVAKKNLNVLRLFRGIIIDVHHKDGQRGMRWKIRLNPSIWHAV